MVSKVSNLETSEWQQQTVQQALGTAQYLWLVRDRKYSIRDKDFFLTAWIRDKKFFEEPFIRDSHFFANFFHKLLC